MSLKQQASSGSEINEKLSALMTNASAVKAIAAAVEGTIGPKGLDTMLVDKFGEVVITNDGVTILSMMEANHPAAKMLINIAKAQQAEIGDGTTTATIMAGAMVNEGVEQVIKGVPVTRVIEGIRIGVKKGLEELKQRSRSLEGPQDPLLKQIALVAGREHEDIAQLVVEAAQMVGEPKLKDKNFRFSDIITAEEGADNQVFSGVIVNKEPMSDLMPQELDKAAILIIDDALEPEEIEDEALSTEAGFSRYLELQNAFSSNVQKIVQLGVNLVLVDRGVDDTAEEILTDAGIMVIQRAMSKDIKKVAEHTGARAIKRTGLRKDIEDLKPFIGKAEKVVYDEKLEHVQVLHGAGKPMATILVGAATEEVVGERERIAKDAAASVQAAIKGGVVPGGGSIELAVAREVEKARDSLRGMGAYGVDCVITALKKPLSQIVFNAGYNPLEKLGDVIAAQTEKGKDSLGIDCDSGDISDMLELGVVDPALVKIHALKAAGEISEAILRIDTIIKKREDKSGNDNLMDI